MPSKTLVESPVLVEVVRGQMVESRHRVTIAIADHTGKIISSCGPIDQPIYGRSAIKPFFAMSLIESGAADRFRLSDEEIALACASHNGEPAHVDAVLSWLERLGLSNDDLECGPQAPSHDASWHDMIRAGQSPTRAHNNCSGKHAGFLTLAQHLGVSTQGYVEEAHQVQRYVWDGLGEMCDLNLAGAARGIDGCGIPVLAMPLSKFAIGMARMARPAGLAPTRAASCARVLKAMTDHPFNVGGTGRFCTKTMTVLKGKAAIKPGAEGVYSAALPELGLGIALKVEDGASRISEVAMGRVLRGLGVLSEEAADRLAGELEPIVRNWAGVKTGVIRATEDWPLK